jgi:hypothetical protein
MDNITKNVSPLSLQIRLYYCGMRGINLLADLTNYIMLEMGQPTHAFDGNKIDEIKIGTPDADCKFTTLDNTERDITTDTLLIKNATTHVAIAGIMAMDPKVLILDEPTAGFDPKGRDEILNKISEYRAEKKSTVILVSHNMEDISRVCDKVLVMKDSKIEMFAPVDEVFEHSADLCAMGLNVPQITRIFLSLKEKGFDVPSSVYTSRQACDAILKIIGGAAK